MRTSDDLDAAIDQVATAMTDGAPDAAFTARVLARLESTPPPRSPLIWRAAFVAAAIVVAMALAVWRPWPGRMRETPATTAARESVRTDPPADRRRDTSTLANDRATTEIDHGNAPTRAAIVQPAQTIPLSPSVGGEVPGSIDVTPVPVDPLPVAAVDPPDSIQPTAMEPVAPIAIAPLGERQ